MTTPPLTADELVPPFAVDPLTVDPDAVDASAAAVRLETDSRAVSRHWWRDVAF